MTTIGSALGNTLLFSRRPTLSLPLAANTPLLPTSNANNPVPLQLIVDPHGPTPMGVTTTQIAAAAARGDLARKKRPETLFGPDVGGEEVGEKGWVKEGKGEGAEGEGKVPLEVVRGWVERAKKEEGIHPTTTLQSQVNLLRPTLTLLPSSTQPSNHLLQFSYDATTPLVLITLTLHPNPASASASARRASMASATGREQVTEIYRGVGKGGFGEVWRLEEGKGMDLAGAVEKIRMSEDDASTVDGKEAANGAAATAQPSSTPAVPSTPTGAATPTPAAAPAIPTTLANPATRPSRLLSLLPFSASRRRQTDLEAQLLADVSGNTRMGAGAAGAGGEAMEMTEQGGRGQQEAGEEEKEEEGKKEEGMRVLIRLDGLDADGNLLPSPNAQLTHILITGTWIGAAAPSTPAVPGTPAVEEVAEEGAAAAGGAEVAAAAGEGEGPEAEGKRRVWVIKVNRREAVIGAHTFLLKEIYGLSSSTTPDAPVSNPPASYPPTGTLDDPYASTPNECIVCLTSPRDVVLLPCRHLVVCRECAVGMIEFGAGGKVARREEVPEVTVTPAVAGEGAEGEAVAGGAATAAAVPVPAPTPAPTRERRKRKAKGWFCPVCRQPYTSLLRLALPHSEAAHAHGPSRGVSRAPSRAPSIHPATAALASGGASLHRVSSRATIATLPARGEKMLQEIAAERNGAGGEEDDEVDVVEGQIETEQEKGQRLEREGVAREEREREVEEQRPQFVLGEEIGDGETHEHEHEQEHVEAAVVEEHAAVEDKKDEKKALEV